MLFFILLSIILFFFCLYFYYSIQKLKQQIIKLEQETKTILERKIINTQEDKISINDISISKPKDLSENKNIIPKEETTKLESSENIPSKKYIARTTNQEYQEPIIKNPITTTLTKEITNTTNAQKQSTQKLTITTTFDPIEFIKKNNEFDNFNDNKEIEYLEEIAKKLENELIPQTIDLTDYEKNQEEQAVISYQELLNLKEKTINQEEQDKIFLEDLKALRNLLESSKYK